MYRPVADRGALIFFLMNELSKIHTFYMYSLETFVVVVNRAIDSLSEGRTAAPKPVEAAATEAPDGVQNGEQEKPDGEANGHQEGEDGQANAKQDNDAALQLTPRSLKKRVAKLTETITKFAFNYIRRGLFERHKLIVAAILGFRILVRDGTLHLE